MRSARACVLPKSSMALRWLATSAFASSMLGNDSGGNSRLQEGANIFRAHLPVVDQLRQGIHLAVKVDKDIRPFAGRQHVAELLECPHEGPRAVALPPGLRHLRDPLLLAEARGLLLVLLVKGERLLAAVAAGVSEHAFGQREAIVPRELARHHHQLLAVEGLVHGLAAFGCQSATRRRGSARGRP